MYRDQSDAALVGFAHNGDKAAFAELLDRHGSVLSMLCRRALGDSDLARDAAQEVTLQALLSLGQLRRPERFGSWLAGIGLNVCRSWLRHRNRDCWSWEALQGGRQVLEPISSGPDPAEVAELAEFAARMRFAVNGLPRGQRAAVLLF
jgi:RNA polymerase sigma-70 factor (ECF subfamily)